MSLRACPVRKGARALRVASLCVPVLVWLGACGATDAGMPSGTGGKAGQGAGGATAAGTTSACPPGDTRPCAGASACAGVQICTNVGWNACDCASAGGAAGATAVGGGAAGNGDVMMAGQADGGASEGGAAAVDAPDPCPNPGAIDPEVTDCAGDCSGAKFIKQGCVPRQSACMLGPDSDRNPSTSDQDRYTDTRGWSGPLLRVPAASAIGGPCSCENGTPIYAKFETYASNENALTQHVEVRLPWHVGLADPETGCVPIKASQCEDLSNGTQPNLSNVQVWTEDPAAPAVNVIYSEGPCPT